MIGFTSFDRDIVIDGVTYYANTAIDPTAIKQDAEAGANDFQAKGFIDGSLISDTDLRMGRYQGESVDVFVGDFISKTRVKTLVKGTWGQIKKNNLTWEITVNTNADKLNKGVVQKLQETCRWIGRLDSPRCGINKTAFSLQGTITGSISGNTFDTGIVVADRGYTDYLFGASAGAYLIAETGNNVGFRLDLIETSASGFVTLAKNPPYAFQVGDVVRLYPGCTGTHYVCDHFFNNQTHWGGCNTQFNFFPNKEDLRK